jgi:hypothetical protein
LGVRRKAGDLALRKNYCCEIRKVKTGCNLAESSKEGYGSKRAVLLMMMMVLLTTGTA